MTEFNCKFIRICPSCFKGVLLKNEKTQKRQIKLNKPCKFCSSKLIGFKARRRSMNTWKPIIGRWPVRKLTLQRIKRFWKTLSDKEKSEIISKSPSQKIYFWGHLKRKNRIINHRHCRETMALRYAGDKHWMKRPEVLTKVRKTFEKYRGDGHWFRRAKA